MTLAARFKVLAVPFGGPIPKRNAPDGSDLDGEWFSARTATGLSLHAERPLLFHHGRDPLKFMATAPIGTARHWRKSERGWIADVELNANDPRVELLQLLSDRVELFGSTSVDGGKVLGDDGEILRCERAFVEPGTSKPVRHRYRLGDSQCTTTSTSS